MALTHKRKRAKALVVALAVIRERPLAHSTSPISTLAASAMRRPHGADFGMGEHGQ